MEVQLHRELCKGCGVCIPVCPTKAISLVDGIAEIDQSLCTQCQACIQACPPGAISVNHVPIAVHPKITESIPEEEVVTVETIPLPATNRFITTLSNVGSMLLPRVANILFNVWEQHVLADGGKSHSLSAQNPEVPTRYGGRGYRRRFGGGRAGHRSFDK